MRRRFFLILFAIAISGGLFLAGTSFYLDLLWFRELQYAQVFWTSYLTRWGLRLGAWLFFFTILFVNLLITRRHILSFPNLFLREKLMASGFMHMLTPRRLTGLFLAVSAVVSFIFSGYAGTFWMELLHYFNHVNFNLVDPIFGVDAAFYVFRLPFYRFIYGFLMMVFVVNLIIVGAIYLAVNPPARGRPRLQLSSAMGISHVSVLLAAIFSLKAWDYRLQQFELLFSERGVVFGAGYTDINANLPALQVLMVLAAVIALVFLANVYLRRYRFFLYGILVLTGVSILGGWAYPASIQGFVVEPSEFSYEQGFIAHNIASTRFAYGIDQFYFRHYDPSEALNWDDLRENQGTINNVRLWDRRPLLTTINELQALRPYYRFVDVDIDRYVVDGELRQVMLAARELDKSRLAVQAQTWVNMHLQWTHGYGVAMSPVNEVTDEGLPRFFLGDIPPVGSLTLTNPAIYFGELTDDYVIINTNTPEFHFAADSDEGDQSEFIFYDGNAGIPLHSVFRRALMALRFGDYRILISGELSNDSRILFDRNIHTRVRKIAPFLRFDGDPYVVVHDGRLFWIQDAYTVTRHFPYSAPHGDINYIRNSVKVVIDAFHGNVHYYVVDPDDPLVQTYNRIFPTLFRPFEEMPEGLAAHIRYPADLFNVQAQMLTLYHMTNPNSFYNREELWAIPMEQSFEQDHFMEPHYAVLQMPGYAKPEFVLTLPFTPDKRNNMIAWMVARSDRPNYGSVEVFEFPRERVILGPNQVENRIDQNTEISEQFTLWGQVGSRVIRGNLLILPINNALLYVEPIFLEAEGGGLPELARVIVIFQEMVVMEDTLELALIRIFGPMGGVPPVQGNGDLPAEPPTDGPLLPGQPIGDDARLMELIRNAQTVYEEALQRQREGDWAGYGEKIKQLEQILAELARFAS